MFFCFFVFIFVCFCFFFFFFTFSDTLLHDAYITFKNVLIILLNFGFGYSLPLSVLNIVLLKISQMDASMYYRLLCKSKIISALVGLEPYTL